MSTKHSPGPWKDISESPSKTWIGNSYVIAEVIRFPEQQEESKANARLIASAPELLEVLKKILSMNPSPHDDMDHNDFIDTIIASERVIAKAEGAE
jgi:hypothetical protein